jgi:hypothetical protein
MFDFNGVPRLSKLAPPWELSSALLTDISALLHTNRLCYPPSGTGRSCTCIVASSQAPSSISRNNPAVRCASAAFHRRRLLFICLVSPR